MIQEICLGFWSLYYCCFCSIVSRDLYNEYLSNNNSNNEIDKAGLKTFLAEQLPNHMMPKRIRLAAVSVGHRFKRA